MLELKQQACEVCRADTPPVSAATLAQLLPQIPDWQVVVDDEVSQLRREFKFSNFAQALAFGNRVGELAEAADHHPAILIEWGKVTLSWWTHTIRGLHINDLILAARCDQAYAP